MPLTSVEKTLTNTSPQTIEEAMIPHPPFPLGSLRPKDIALLLAAGAVCETTTRVVIMWLRAKPQKVLHDKEQALKVLQYETAQKRRLGPSAFVETSKLERQVLKQEQELAELYTARKNRVKRAEQFFKNLILVISMFVFFIYFGIPIITLEGSKLQEYWQTDHLWDQKEAEAAASRWYTAAFFPISYVGLGLRMSRFGLEAPYSSVGALLVFWSSQVTVGKIMEGLEALVLL